VTLAVADLRQLGAIAAGVLTECEPEFTAGIGAAEEVTKGIGDYATAVDLALERRISAALVDRTGLGVHGEEFGGAELSTGMVWVLDPVDGTANFSQSIPLTGINLALLIDGVPKLGLTWLPLLDQRFMAVEEGPVTRNGIALPPLTPGRIGQTVVSFGHVGAAGGRYPTGYRVALFHAVASRALRIRIMGTSALEFAWVASGVFSAAVSFGNKAWDTAPGACLVRAAGGAVMDLGGRPHGLDSPSMVAARPGVAEELLEILAQVGDPSSYRAQNAFGP
jgi:myo-inositol-1(or 4)-monophosphatase